ncbi:MAG: cbb3-type cytochrome oxidase assembly protein CcoS [Dichotomicrobium sp.]
MTALAWLIPAALFLGLLGVLAFLWALRSGQFEDLDGAAYRALEDDPPDAPKPEPRRDPPSSEHRSEHGLRRDHAD